MIRKNLEAFFDFKLLFVLGFNIIYTYIMMKKIPEEISCFEAALLILANKKYLTFFLFPVLLYLMKRIMQNSSLCLMIRHKSYMRYYLSQIFSMCFLIILFLMILIVFTIFNVSQCFLVRNEFLFDNNLIYMDTIRDLMFYRKVFGQPLQAFICTMCYLMFGVSSLMIHIYTVELYINKTLYTTLLCIIYFGMVFAVNRGGNWRESCFFANTYFILSMAKNTWIRNVLIMCGLNLFWLGKSRTCNIKRTEG